MPRWAAFLREYFGPDALIDGVRTFAAFYPASSRLTLLATGALIQAVHDGASYVLPLVVVAAIFAVQRVLDPIREELGNALWPRVDQWLGMDTVGCSIALGTAMTVVQAILSAGMLSRYEDADYALAQAKWSLGSVLGVLRWSDRAHRRGRIVERGTHAELMQQDGLYAELYGLQASAYR